MTSPLVQSSLLTPLISSAVMRAILDDRARLQRMLDFEVALARAEAAVGIVPASAIHAIVEAARAECYDLAALGEAAVAAGNIAIPLVNALAAEVAKTDATAAGYVHWGATSQDVIDSALVLELRAAIDTLIADLDRAIDGFTPGGIATPPPSRAPGCSTPCPCRSGSSLPATRRRSVGRVTACNGCGTRRSCCNSVARRARSPRSTIAGSRSPSGWPRCSICRFRMRHGTPTVIGWPRWRRRLRSSPAPAARSPAMFRS
jgi:hypothetical protein